MVELCKVKHDGSHYVATPYKPSNKKNTMRDTSKSEYDLFFDTSFEFSCSMGLKSEEQRQYIINEFCDKFGYAETIPQYVYKQYIKKMHALHERLKRFCDIVYLNRWTHFVTFTYDDKLHTPESFVQKLKKTLQNLHTRRGWLYAGVFEKSPEEERVHFHGLFNISDMVGEIEEVQDYSFKTHQMQITHSNTYFRKRFGRNDFEELSQEELKYGNTLNYITKYIIKQNQKIVYSRGLQSPKYCFILEDDITAEIEDYGLQYVLYDDFDIHSTAIELTEKDIEYPSYFPADIVEAIKRAKYIQSPEYYKDMKKWFYNQIARKEKAKMNIANN